MTVTLLADVLNNNPDESLIPMMNGPIHFSINFPESYLRKARLNESITDNVTATVVAPAELVAVTVKEVEARIAVGVPLIAQLDDEIESPAGSAGEMVQETAPPPLLKVVGVTLIAALTMPEVPVAPE